MKTELMKTFGFSRRKINQLKILFLRKGDIRTKRKDEEEEAKSCYKKENKEPEFDIQSRQSCQDIKDTEA